MASSTDEELLQQAEEFLKEEKLLMAARLLRTVQDKDQHLTEYHHKLLRVSQLLEQAVQDFLLPPDQGRRDGGDWKKQGESHGNYDTTIHYKVDSGARMTCRIETPIPPSLLVPLLSVLNESSLYQTWIPSWKRPVRFGVRESNQILNDRRGHQVVHLLFDSPWPMATRELLMDVVAVDDIEETGCIIAKMQTLGAQQKDGHSNGGQQQSSTDGDAFLLPPDFSIPAPGNNVVRVDFEGAMLFRACPTDHPHYASSSKRFGTRPILVSYTKCFDAHMAVLPQSVINFATRTVIGQIWKMLLHVGEEVREGKRDEHVQKIQERADLYEWIEQGCQKLLSGLDEKVQPAGKAGVLQAEPPISTVVS